MTADEVAADRPPNDVDADGAGAANPGADERLSYEDAREQLVTVVQQLEAGGIPLQASVELWERGERLADICQHWLDGARVRLDAATAARTPTP